MGGGGGFNAASDQDAHCGCEPEGRFRLSGVSLRTRSSLAASEKHRQVSRDDPGENAPEQPATNAGNRGRDESDHQRLVVLFSPQRAERLWAARSIRAAKATRYPAQTTPTQRPPTWRHISTLAQCLLRGTRANP